MNQHAANKILRARTSLLLAHFFWGRLALYLKMVEKPEIPTLAVDGKHIFYNPDFVMGLSDDLVKSAVVHEIGHCMYEHIFRRKGRDKTLWNKAGDYVINQMILDAGFRIGDGWLHDGAFKGMYSEQIYDILKKEQDDQAKNGTGDIHGSGRGEPLCDILDDSASDAEQVSHELEWKVAVVQAATEAKRQGKLPACMERFVDEITENKVPWREVLMRFATTVRKDDYTWSRPNRRYVAMNTYIPSMYSEGMGEMVAVIDTSGSIDDHTLQTFGAEIRAIVQAVRPTQLHVIYCDAAVNHVDVFSPDDQIEFKAHGGGGTDFRPPFKYVEEQGLRPECLIYLTDLYGSFPDEAEFPVLWCATTDLEAPFGETVHIDL